MVVKLLLSTQMLMLSLYHDGANELDTATLFWPYWIMFTLFFILAVAVSFLFVSKVLTYCCLREETDICKFYNIYITES